MLHVANPANLIYPSIRDVVWANPGSLANLICLMVHIAVLANPVNPARVILLHLDNAVNPAVVTQIFSFVRDLCNNTCCP
jgi:hypothetical protein